MRFRRSVRTILPPLPVLPGVAQARIADFYPADHPMKRESAAPAGVDAGVMCSIIYLTLTREVELGSQWPAPRQGRFPTSPSCPSSQTPGGPRSSLHLGQPLLRPPGPGPGQVRDAAPRPGGGASGQPDGGHLRVFPSLLLSGPVPARWPACYNIGQSGLVTDIVLDFQGEMISCARFQTGDDEGLGCASWLWARLALGHGGPHRGADRHSCNRPSSRRYVPTNGHGDELLEQARERATA